MTPPSVPPSVSIYGKLSAGLFVPSGSWGTLRFDARGELVGPDAIDVIVPAEPSPGFESGDANEEHPEQPLILRLRTRRGKTTQYAGSFIMQLLEPDGRRAPPRRTRACFFDPRLRDDPVGGEGIQPFVDARGRLVANARQHYVGHRIDPVSGVQETEVSNVQIPIGTMPPRATTMIALELARDSAEPIVQPGPDANDVPYDVQSPIWISIFDLLGRLIPLELRLVRSASDTWSWFLVEDPARLAPSSPAFAQFDAESAVQPNLINALGPEAKVPMDLTATPGFEFVTDNRPPTGLEIPDHPVGIFSNALTPSGRVLPGGRGRLFFDAEGRLAAVEQEGVWLAPDQSPIVVRPARSSDEIDQRIVLDLGVGRSRLADTEAVLLIDQDGHAAGVLTSLRIGRDFVFEGIASSGVVVPLSSLAFAAPGQRVCELACSNGRDDDRDGQIDFSGDPSCVDPADNDESPPDGSPIPRIMPTGR